MSRSDAPGTRKLLSVGAQAVSVTVAGKPLLHDITLTLARSGVTVVMGYNGAGKSLLIRVLHGLIPPTKGTVFETVGINGENAYQAMVFQKPTLLRRTVSANLKFAMTLRSAFSQTWHDELLDNVGLLQHATQPARSLSGGEQQRLAMARALSLRPDILFLDEPTASLDPHSAQIIERLVREAAERNTKVILVTHDIGQARRLANEVLFIHHGRISDHELAGTFFESPTSTYAKAYLQGQLYV